MTTTCDDTFAAHSAWAASYAVSLAKYRMPADEAKQSGLIGLWRAVRRYRSDGGASLRSFAAKHIQWTVFKECSRSARRPQEAELSSETVIEARGDDDAAVRDLLRKCSARQRALITARICAGMTFQEIARRHGFAGPSGARAAFGAALASVVVCDSARTL